MIIYFTGTGNSRYLAQTLAKQLNDTAVDAAALIKKGEHPTFTSEKPYVFLSPVYAWRIPRLFMKWLRDGHFEGNKKVYFLLNCGSEIGAAGKYLEKSANKMGLTYMGTAEVVMPENYLIMFDPPKAEEDKEIVRAATAETRKLAERIAGEQPFDKVKIGLVGHIYSDLVNPMFYTFYIGARKFYATDACISCGKCVKSCMLNNITLKDGRPVWGRDCTHCMACICNCPTEAIEYGNNTKGRRRYLFKGEDL